MSYRTTVIAERDRLVVRLFQRFNVGAMNRIFGDPAVIRFGSSVQIPEWADARLCRRLENYQQKSDIGPWTVIEKQHRSDWLLWSVLL